jgi:flagellar basal body-associated protein FliL
MAEKKTEKSKKRPNVLIVSLITLVIVAIAYVLFIVK